MQGVLGIVTFEYVTVNLTPDAEVFRVGKFVAISYIPIKIQYFL
jgi:hypothetical protein